MLVIYSSVLASKRTHNKAREIQFGLFDGRKYGEHSGDGRAEIHKIFATQGDFFYGATPFDRVYN